MWFKCYDCGKDCEHGTWVERELCSGKSKVTIKVPLCSACLKKVKERSASLI